MLSDQSGQQQRVGVGDGSGGQRPAGVDELGAGGHDGDSRARYGAHRSQADRGEGGDRRRRQERAGRQDRVAGAEVLARVPHVGARGDGSADLDLGRQGAGPGGLVGVLDLDDGVRAFGEHGAGHDSLGGSRGQGGGGGSGRDVRGHGQDDGCVRRGGVGVPGPHRVAVHPRVRPRRHAQRRHDVLGQDQAVRLRQGGVGCGQGRQRGEDLGEVVLRAEQLGHDSPFGRVGGGAAGRPGPVLIMPVRRAGGARCGRVSGGGRALFVSGARSCSVRRGARAPCAGERSAHG